MPLPALAVSGIGAGLGALTNAIFGGTKTLTDEQIQKLMEELPKYDDQEARTSLQRRVAAALKNRQVQTSQKNKSLGIADPQSVYTLDEPIFEAQATESNKITELKAQDDAKRKEVLAKLKMAQMEEENAAPDVFQRGLEGGITGFTLGSRVAGLMGKTLPNTTGGTNKVTEDATNSTFNLMNKAGSDLKLDNTFANPTPVDSVPIDEPTKLSEDILDNNQSMGELGNSDEMNNLARKYKLNYNKFRRSLLTPYGIG